MNVIDFGQLSMDDLAKVGGKNASLGELYRNLQPLGVDCLDGFAITTDAYRLFLEQSGLASDLAQLMSAVDARQLEELARISDEARSIIRTAEFSAELRNDIEAAFIRLCQRLDIIPTLAVRSSATTEDLPGLSFAGQHETILNIQGKVELLDAVKACFASLFTERAIDYRHRNGISEQDAALSVGVQPMVRSDLACAGVIFTLDTESGFRDVVQISGSYGLGELVVRGKVIPDEWTVFKSTLGDGFVPILRRELGSKERRLTFAEEGSGTRQVSVPVAERSKFCLTDVEIIQLAEWACAVERHYSQLAGHAQPMDLEWAKDGISGRLMILQARPETVHSRATTISTKMFKLVGKPPAPLVSGQAVGEKVASGPVRILRSAANLTEVQEGDILVAQNTDPDWEPVMKKDAAIVTDQGGRTAHAAIISREIGIPCVVGTQKGTSILQNGSIVTVSCCEGSVGNVYRGPIRYAVETISANSVPATETKVMLNVADPGKAFTIANYPNDGVGLARMEFIIANSIGIHPMALVRYPNLADPASIEQIARKICDESPTEFFVRRLSEGIGTIAAAFYPNPVIVRTSDFKTNEYARLLGGTEFEPSEENPMLGFRGASRYYDSRYEEGFGLECRALLRVRREMGLTNLKVMIPFCRTPDEAKKVITTMAKHGLRKGDQGLEIYCMCEIPSNALEAEAFLKIFDGFSIGSNDLTQLTLGIDRDAGTISHLFNEAELSVKELIRHAVEVARKLQKPVGICGQAPSDDPEFAKWLVEIGITSISLNPDTVLKTIPHIAAAETMMAEPNLSETGN